MNQEIERKFLVASESWRAVADAGRICRQGYILSGMGGVTVRVRQIGGQGYVTFKGPARGISRAELEYEIPVADAEYMLDHFCAGHLISKVRYHVVYHGFVWEVDEFSGVNQGLVVAEIELEREDQAFDVPEWIGAEVSHERRYTNAALATHPFTAW
ncbi:MAG: CYTH domain-containing protein [Kiritimatiellaceae bacterium]|nr:CYTH domain-containing protein [Kiritimatiellaceae bacterium]